MRQKQRKSSGFDF